MQWVSNHGGRQLDAAEGTLTVLPEIVHAVAGRAKIIVDGGFMRGTDVVKAVALGADCVAIGRLVAIALAAGGEEALVRMFDLLHEETHTAVGLMGAKCLADLTPRSVKPAPPVVQPHVFSAFPLLNEYTRDYTRD
eukprot:SAG31_NODE_9768_length_1230_cov_1.584439_1_plen_136_part_00